jgi:glycosyltransferase involved in cell wall biosynthesis
METQVRALARQQHGRGDDVVVVTATRGEGVLRGRDDDAGVSIERITMNVPGGLPIHLRARARVSEELRRIDPDVVHVHVGEVSPFAWGALRAIRRLGLARVVSVHSVWSPGMRVLAASWGRAWVTPSIVTAVSSMAADLVAHSVRLPVEVIPNGIDTGVWRPRPMEPHAGVRFVAVQRLAPRKRTGALIRAFAAASTNSTMHLDIVGDGPDRSRMERRVRAWGREGSITFLGRLAPEEIRRHFARSDVFVQASRRESFGIAALEARACGLPVIALRDSGTADFIHSGIHGLLARDDACLTRAILAMGQDDVARAMFASHNASTPVAQSWSRVLPSVDDAYQRARGAIRLSR